MRTNDKHPWQLFSYYCHMNWNQLTHIAQLETIDRDSATQPILIFKHSTRCSTSSMALARVERSWGKQTTSLPTPFYLDLIKHRDISNSIAERYGVEHQSPQVLVIAKSRCIYSQTHSAISVEEMLQETQQG